VSDYRLNRAAVLAVHAVIADLNGALQAGDKAVQAAAERSINTLHNIVCQCPDCVPEIYDFGDGMAVLKESLR